MYVAGRRLDYFGSVPLTDTIRVNMDRESNDPSLLENAVAKNDTLSLKSLLEGEIYKLGYLKAALVKAVEANNVDVVQLLLDHVEPVDFLLCIVCRVQRSS